MLGFRLYNDLLKNKASAKYQTLLSGTDWTYDNQTIHMHGLIYVLAHFFFANYTRENGVHDTFSGHMTHNWDEGSRVSDVHRAQIEKRARETAARFFKEVKLYLDNHTDTYPYWCYDSGNKKSAFKPRIKRLSRPVTNTMYESNWSNKRFVTGSTSSESEEDTMKTTIAQTLSIGNTVIENPFTYPVIPQDVTFKDSTGGILGGVYYAVNQSTGDITVTTGVQFVNAIISIEGW